MSLRKEAERSYSFVNLPLNVLILILSNLNLQDLENISKTCKILRSLANKKLITNLKSRCSSNSYFKFNGDHDELFTIKNKVVVIDVFNLLNNNRYIIEKLNYKHRILIFESIRKLRIDYNLIYDNSVQNKIDQELNLQSNISIGKDENAMENTNNESNLSLVSNDEYDSNNTLNDIELSSNSVLLSNDKANNNIYGTLNVKPIELASFEDDMELYEDDSFENEVEDMETKINQRTINGIDSEFIISPTSSLPLNKELHLNEIQKHNENNENTASVLSASTTLRKTNTSVNNQSPSSISEVDNFPDTEQLLRSIKSITELRTSKKVKEKAALFEKLFSGESASLGDLLMNNDTYNSLINSLPALQELELSKEQKVHLYHPNSTQSQEDENTAVHLQSSTRNSTTSKSRSISQNYLDKVEKEQSNSNSHDKTALQNVQRRKLKAIINSDNKISYQRI